MTIKKFGIVSRCNNEDVLEMVRSIVHHFATTVEIAVDQNTSTSLGLEGIESVPVDKMRDTGVEFIVSVGGDGTVLRNISRMDDPLPILGVNMGTLGFLVDVEPSDAIETIENTLHGFQYTEHTRLAVSLNCKALPCATNEVVLITARPAKILTFEVVVDSCKVEELRADGVVIATPTGSTAYAMSAGGPIIDPRVGAVLIVPLAPFKLSARPWVVPSNGLIKVEMTMPEKEAAIVIDGQHTYSIHKCDQISITQATNPARFVTTPLSGFYQRVQNKLR
ncbi:MAG: NAD(+)/NADH kinase [Euryarchaeota archaeon]|nr:NAD(+)/NADH kinase [Euryarchaeota archaeon]